MSAAHQVSFEGVFSRSRLRVACAIAVLLHPASNSYANDVQTEAQMPDPETTKRIIHLLPSYTESVVVVGPTRYLHAPMPKPIGYRNGQPLFAPDASRITVTVEGEAFRCNTSFFDIQPQLAEFCRTQEVEMSVFAFRAGRTGFEIPGGTKSEGCQIIVTKADVPQAIREIFREAPLSLAGFPVLPAVEQFKLTGPVGVPKPSIFTEPKTPVPAQEPKKRYYFALPSHRVLIAATSEQFLRDVLEAFAKRHAAANFPMPSHLPGKRVTVWGMRRLGSEFSPTGPTSIVQDDPQATSLLLTYDSANNSLNIRYQSQNSQSEQILTKAIGRLMELRANPRRIDKETVEVSVENIDGRIWIGVISMLGIVPFV